MEAVTAMTGSGTVKDGRLWMPETGITRAMATALLTGLAVDIARETREDGREI